MVSGNSVDVRKANDSAKRAATVAAAHEKTAGLGSPFFLFLYLSVAI